MAVMSDTEQQTPKNSIQCGSTKYGLVSYGDIEGEEHQLQHQNEINSRADRQSEM